MRLVAFCSMIEEKAKRNALDDKMNAARASHPSRMVRGLPGLLFPLCGEMLEVRQPSLGGVLLLPELVADHDFHHRSASTAGTSGLILFKDRMRRRPQCPDTQHALTRGLELSPEIAAGSVAIIQQAQEALTFSLPTLCGRAELPAIGKPRRLVQKL